MSELGCLTALICVLAVLLPGLAGERLFRLVVLLALGAALAMLHDLTRRPPPS